MDIMLKRVKARKRQEMERRQALQPGELFKRAKGQK